MIFSKNLDYAGEVPLVEEKASLKMVIIKGYMGVEAPNGHFFKLKCHRPVFLDM